MDQANYERGRDFIEREGRVLEQRLAAAVFDGGPGDAVVDALRGFQNPDGGFAYGLEPDTRCPVSLPICATVALQAMAAAGVVDEPMVRRTCDHLASVADADGLVALASPAIEAHPRAVHMTEWTYQPSLNPTAGLVGLLHQLDVDHPWRDRAGAGCWDRLEADGMPTEAHGLHEVAVFLEHVPDRRRAEALAPAVADALPVAEWFLLDPAAEGYGVTPLHLAPTPDSPWRALFDDATIDGHVARLAAEQGDDGGWAIAWEPPGVAATQEYRAVRTVQALQTLRAYG
jgi:hypothetical protein